MIKEWKGLVCSITFLSDGGSYQLMQINTKCKMAKLQCVHNNYTKLGDNQSFIKCERS
jgi:hypothetical protein